MKYTGEDDERVDPITGFWRDGGWSDYPCEYARPRFAPLDTVVDWKRFNALKNALAAKTPPGPVLVPKANGLNVLTIDEGRTLEMETLPRKSAASASVPDQTLDTFIRRVIAATDLATQTENIEVRRAITKYEIDPAWVEFRETVMERLGLKKQVA